MEWNGIKWNGIKYSFFDWVALEDMSANETN